MRAQPTTWALAIVVALVGLVTGTPSAEATGRALPLTRVRDIPVPGRSSRFDYQSVDAQDRRLYVAHLGDSTLDVVDLETSSVVATVPDLASVHGVLVVPELGRVFASATGTNELVAIDQSTNQVVARTATGRFPDGIAYDQRDDLVLVSNKDGGTESLVEGRTGRPVGEVRLGREVGNVAYDPADGLAYAAVRPPDELAVLDPAAGTATGRIPLRGCRGAHGVYVVAKSQRAFVACEQNATIATVDLAQRRQTGLASIGEDPDVLAYDPVNDRLYVAAESGTVTVFAVGSERLHKLGQAHLADAAHSVAVDPATHLVYFPLQRDPKAPGIRVMQPVATGP